MEKGKTFYYENNHNVNKKIYAFGLDGSQWMIGMIGVLLFGVVFFLKRELLIVALPVSVGLVMFIAKVKKENSKGNPDYMGALFVEMSTPKYLTDSTQVFKRIKKNGQRL